MNSSQRSKLVSCLVGIGLGVLATGGASAWAQTVKGPGDLALLAKKPSYAPLVLQALERGRGKPLSGGQRDLFLAASKSRGAAIKAANDEYAQALSKATNLTPAVVVSILDNTVVPSGARVSMLDDLIVPGGDVSILDNTVKPRP
jgi:hypothetical protein